MCKYACHISKLNWIVVNPFSLCRHFGNNREDAAYKNIERTPSLLQVVNVDHHHPFFSCQRGSSSSSLLQLSTWIIIIIPSSVVNVDHHHPFFSCQRGSIIILYCCGIYVFC
jgi:hypothetical protein